MKQNQTIETYAQKLLVENGLYSVPIDISKLVRQLGIIKHEEFLEDGMWGLAITEGSKKIISINKAQSETRKRFTIAHELAHILLDSEVHINVDQKIYYRDGTRNWREIRANYFAASILMPKGLLLNELQKISPDLKVSDDEVEALAKKFKVSPQSMCIRFEGMNFI